MSSPIRRALRALRADLHIHSQEASPRRRFAVLLRRVAKYGLAAVFYYSGLTGRLLRRCLVSRDGALILGYHGISTKGPDPFSSNQNLEFLEDQLRFLKHHLRPVRLEEISQPVARGESPPAGAFALTFDDGLVNNVLLAVPLLEELDLPATFFVPSGLVGSPRDLWIASLREIIRAWPHPLLQAEPPLWPELRVDDEQSRFRAFFRVKSALKAHGEPRKAILDSPARRRRIAWWGRRCCIA